MCILFLVSEVTSEDQAMEPSYVVEAPSGQSRRSEEHLSLHYSAPLAIAGPATDISQAGTGMEIVPSGSSDVQVASSSNAVSRLPQQQQQRRGGIPVNESIITLLLQVSYYVCQCQRSVFIGQLSP